MENQPQYFTNIITNSIKIHKPSILSSNFKQGKHSTSLLQYNSILTSQHPYLSSQMCSSSNYKAGENHYQQFTIKTIKQFQNYQQNNLAPYIGMILGEYQEDGTQYNIYGIGVLIDNNFVLTSAQNIYCRRRNTQYKRIKFIPNLNKNNHNGMYNVKRVHYPDAYKQLKVNSEYNNIAILQLHDDLSKKYGYMGIKIGSEIAQNTCVCRYLLDPKQKIFHLIMTSLQDPLEKDNNSQREEGLLVIKQSNNKYYLIGFVHNIGNKKSVIILTDQIKRLINKWTISTQLNLVFRQLGSQICNYLVNYQFNNLTNIYLSNNKIDEQGCKYLRNSNWPDLLYLDLCIQINYTQAQNNINSNGFKYLIEANWSHLQYLGLGLNDIRSEGCKYFKYSKWYCLETLNLCQNKISADGCKHMIDDAKFSLLKSLNLSNNYIHDQGCKYLQQIKLDNLQRINLSLNKIGSEGYKYLKNTNWSNLRSIDLSFNNIIDVEGIQYLKDTGWANITCISLKNHHVENSKYYYLSLIQLWPFLQIG